jgi:hypothetical protein
MSRLVSILRESGISLDLGSGENRFKKDLDKHRHHLFKTFLVLFAVLILLIGLGAFGMWHLLMNGGLDQTKAWVGAFSLAGGSASLVEVLRRVWTQWTRTSLVILLISDAPKPLVVGIVQKLLDKLD